MTVAFFYQQPMALDRAIHQQLRLLPLTDTRFAAQSAAAPLVFSEFAEACLEYPIVFVRSDAGWTAVAVTGLADGENLFVDAQGQWAGRYLPASVRRYPFVLTQRDDSQWGVCIDKACPQVTDAAESSEQSPAGERLFDDVGEPSPMMRSIMTMLFDFQGQAQTTSDWIERLHEAGLLVEANLEIRVPDGRKAGLHGAWMVSEAALKDLQDAAVAGLFRSGDLALVYTHLISLRNLGALLLRRAL